MSEQVILITLIANMIIQPLFTYLLSSRCSKIKCGCIECDRDVMDIQPEKNKEDV